MTTYTAPVKDMQFVLHELLEVSKSDILGYDELEADFTSAVLEEAGKIASEVMHPLNAVGDQEGCTLENGIVRTSPGFAETACRDGTQKQQASAASKSAKTKHANCSMA